MLLTLWKRWTDKATGPLIIGEEQQPLPPLNPSLSPVRSYASVVCIIATRICALGLDSAGVTESKTYRFFVSGEVRFAPPPFPFLLSRLDGVAEWGARKSRLAVVEAGLKSRSE